MQPRVGHLCDCAVGNTYVGKDSCGCLDGAYSVGASRVSAQAGCGSDRQAGNQLTYANHDGQLQVLCAGSSQRYAYSDNSKVGQAYKKLHSRHIHIRLTALYVLHTCHFQPVHLRVKGRNVVATDSSGDARVLGGLIGMHAYLPHVLLQFTAPPDSMKVNDTDDHVAMPSRTLAARIILWIVLESPLQILSANSTLAKT